jgi:hypothetical protein
MGGLANIVEKAMGSIVKSGDGPIHGVLAPGERAARKGLLFASTPASDFICGTLQMAAGMNLHVFTTGRGTPYGLSAVPVVKVATRTELAERWHDLMDLNAGRIATGEATIESVGWELFEMLLAVAGVIAGHTLSRAHMPLDGRRPRDLLRSASALTTGVFAAIVTLTFIHSGLDPARAFSSRLSTSLTILVAAVAAPGWLSHLLTQRHHKPRDHA